MPGPCPRRCADRDHHRTTPPGPRARAPRPRLAEHRRPRPVPRRPARPLRAAGLLGVLLRELPARPRRAAAAGGDVRRRAGRRRACTRRSSCTRPTRTRWRPPSSATTWTTRSSTTPSWSPGRPTPPAPGRRWCWSTPRATSSRSTPARATPTRSTRWSPSCARSTAPRARCSRATRRTSPPSRRAGDLRFPGEGGRARRRRLPGRRRRPPRAWSSSPTTARRRSAGSAPVSAGWSTGPRRRRVQRAQRAVPAARRRRRRGRLRRRGRRHRQPRAARRSARSTARCTTLAGDGRQWMQGDGTVRAVEPVGRGLVAGPGVGRDGRHPPAVDLRPAHRRRSRWPPAPPTRGCSTGRWPRRGSRRPPASRPTGDRLWIADSETSSLRCVEDGAVRTAVGTGLFDFGFRDGAAGQALLQHPLGVTVLPDGSVAVCDTYNGAVRRWAGRRADHARDRPRGAERRRRRRRPPRRRRVGRAPADPGPARRGRRGGRASRTPPSGRSPRSPAGAVELVVDFEPPPGQKVDDRFGPPSQLVVSATPARAAHATATGGAPTSPARPGHRRGRRRRRAARRGAGGLLRRRTAARARPATCTSRTGASRSGWSRAAPRGWCCRCPAGLTSRRHPRPRARPGVRVRAGRRAPRGLGRAPLLES